MLIDNLGLAYAQLLAAMENSKAPPDAADMPEWQRPPRRSNGVPRENSYRFRRLLGKLRREASGASV